MSPNINKDEIHGCVVCGRLFNVLAVYSPDGKLVDLTLTNPGGQIVRHGRHVLVACQMHTSAEVDQAVARWSSRVAVEDKDD